MKELRSPKRTKNILTEFRDYYAAGRVALKLRSVDTSKMKLVSRPTLSGSGGPRSILAYFAAIWRIVQDKTRMQSAGFDETERSIANKVARGKFSFAFVLEVASVLGRESLTFDVLALPVNSSRPPSKRLRKAVGE